MSKADEVKKALNKIRLQGQGIRYIDVQRLYIRYALERFFYRLSLTPHKDNFILKGAMIMPIYLVESHRSTKDADFLVQGDYSKEKLEEVFQGCCLLDLDDGLRFDVEGITIKDAGADRDYPGFDVEIPTWLGNSPCKILIDLAFGEAVTPPALSWSYPCILGEPPNLKAYPPETAVAEKFETIVRRGMANTRLKDYYDLAEYGSTLSFDGSLLQHALLRTFETRGTPIPTTMRIALTNAFYSDRSKRSFWTEFLRSCSLEKTLSLEAACHIIERFLMPLCLALTSEAHFEMAWNNGKWRPKKP